MRSVLLNIIILLHAYAWVLSRNSCKYAVFIVKLITGIEAQNIIIISYPHPALYITWQHLFRLQVHCSPLSDLQSVGQFALSRGFLSQKKHLEVFIRNCILHNNFPLFGINKLAVLTFEVVNDLVN